ncbi:NAD(P)/FAD-dependent oxidoreductase [Streptomyces sp. NPDC017993]|uniref:NAD(P)/FAD-dependent oxidoreductase n=1 Tax=Streptomyces sp. NPDC017993 TaxID=3365027 RepID=UPI003790A0B7
MNASSSTSSTGLEFTHPHLAVVLGGGFTGMLAAAALSEHADVIVVERERLPRTPALPTDLPQARPAHLLTAEGAHAVEALLPGAAERWLAQGARRLPVPPGLARRPSPGWLRLRPPSQYLIACSRDLLDRAVRRQVTALPGVMVLDATEAEDLTGTSEHVTGVRVRNTVTGEVFRLDADLVVDATGRSSTTPDRLTALGLPPVGEEVVESGVRSATRLFRAPSGGENCPAASARSQSTLPLPGSVSSGRRIPARTATLVPVEDGRWLVTLTGSGEDRPSEHADRFVPFARSIPHSVIGDLIADAEPLSEVRLSRDTTHRRRRFDQLTSWPTGFIGLGGAVASFRPDWGQSLSLAARGAAALRAALRRHGMDEPALAHLVQQSIGRLVDAPWAVATGRDTRSSHGPVPPGTAAVRLVRGAVESILGTATGLTSVCRGYVDVLTPASPTPVPRAASVLGLLRSAGRALPAPSGAAASGPATSAPRGSAATSPTAPPSTPSSPPVLPSSAPADARAAVGSPSEATDAASVLSPLPATSAGGARTPTAQQPSAVPSRRDAAQALWRFPRRTLGLGPTSLRRIGGAGRRRPADD